MGPCIANVFSSITNKIQRYTSYFCEMLYMFQAVPPPIIRSSKTVYTPSGTLSDLFCWSSISSTTVAGTIKGLTKYPMLYIQFMSSWWWAEKAPETCRAFHRNILCNVGSFWLYLKIRLRCKDPWTTKTFFTLCQVSNMFRHKTRDITRESLLLYS